MHDSDEHSSHGHRSDGDEAAHEGAPDVWPTRSLALAAALDVAALALSWGRLADDTVVRVLAAAAVGFGGWFLLPSAWAAVRRLRPNINLLMVIATVGAAVIGEWVEAATVVVLFGVAEWLEGWADRRARRAVHALLELAPDVARVKVGGGYSERPAAEVEVGATVLVPNGERVPLDGEVVAGRSAVNQAPITGESVPVEKQAGDPVFAGSINGEGSLEVRVTRAAGDTTLARIIRLVETAQEQKAPAQRFVDAFARYYTPAVALLALLVLTVPPLFFGGAWEVWLYRACVLLIIACPCALVIATPVSVVAGLTALARRGVLVKGGAHLESIGRLQALALDKTGTLTEGKPRVLGVEGIDAEADEALRVAAAIDAHSSHPLAQAIVAHARERGFATDGADAFVARVGRGAEATLAGRPVFVGNHRFAHELGVCTPALEARLAAIEALGRTAIVVGTKSSAGETGRVLGIVTVGDAVRSGARAAVAALHAAGVREIVMLSGDNARTVAAIAAVVGIDHARGDLLPEDKVAAVEQLRCTHAVVGMVGDGVNDAPAMATATVGIAMGAAGADAAIETADIALMRDDLGMIADTGATLLVVGNALRLLRGSGR